MKQTSVAKRCMRFSKPTGLSPAASARKAVLRRIQRQELRKLQALLPQMSGRSFPREPNPCSVILNAVQYIDELHATILARVRTGSLNPEVLQRLNLPQVSEIEQVHNSRTRNNSATLPFSQTVTPGQQSNPAKLWAPNKSSNFSA